MSVLLDAEQFNYGYNPREGSGFRIALADARDKPMLQFSSMYLHGGSEYEINLKPVVTYTTQEAIERFNPEDRNCYVDGENDLFTLPRSIGFRYYT